MVTSSLADLPSLVTVLRWPLLSLKPKGKTACSPKKRLLGRSTNKILALFLSLSVILRYFCRSPEILAVSYLPSIGSDVVNERSSSSPPPPQAESNNGLATSVMSRGYFMVFS